MKNHNKKVILLIGILWSSITVSQIKLDTRIDSWRYWQEMAELGLTPFNPKVSIPEAVYKGTEILTPYGNALSPDILTIDEVNVTQSENSVFVNPNSNNIVVSAYNSIYVDPINLTPNGTNQVTVLGTHALFSFDHGNSWSGGSVGSQSFGDPAAAIDLNNKSYLGYIDTGYDQDVGISANNGLSWTYEDVHSIPGAHTTGALLDKNHLWVDNSPFLNDGTVNPNEGNLYCAWTIFQSSNTLVHKQIQFSRSTDGGLTWSVPILLSSNLPEDHHQGVNIQTGPEGEVYVVWASYDDWHTNGKESSIAFAKSTDGGVTFEPAIKIHSNIRGIRGSSLQNPNNPFPAPPLAPHIKQMRTNSFPCMSADISGGPNNGNIYVVWANHGEPGINLGSDISIYIMKSADNGASWSTPVRVNQDPIGNVQYFPWITCDPATGDISVIFYDDRDVGGTELETWVAVSTDAGTSWYDFRVSDVSFSPSPIDGMAGNYMGDYIGISARGGRVYPVWTDNRTGVAKSYCSPFILGCEYDIAVTNPVFNSAADHREALNTITASNTINSGAEAVYHAGTEVLMTTDFTSFGGSTYRAYIEQCDGSFIKSATYDPSEPLVESKKPKITEYFENKEASIALNIYPNPTSKVFSIELTNESFLKTFEVKIFSLSGGLVYSNYFNNQTKVNQFQVDISQFKAGIYFIEISDTEQEKIYSGKIVKQ